MFWRNISRCHIKRWGIKEWGNSYYGSFDITNSVCLAAKLDITLDLVTKILSNLHVVHSKSRLEQHAHVYQFSLCQRGAILLCLPFKDSFKSCTNIRIQKFKKKFQICITACINQIHTGKYNLIHKSFPDINLVYKRQCKVHIYIYIL